MPAPLYGGQYAPARGPDYEPANRAAGGPTWTIDATSGIAVPADATEWASFITDSGLSIAAPDALWLMQEASGNLADSIGSFTLAASGSGLSYQQTQSGWSRTGVQTTDGTAGRWQNTAAALPNVATESCLLLVYANITAAAGASTRSLIEIGTTTDARVRVNTTPRMLSSSGGNLSAAGASSPVGQVRPYVLKVDRTGSVVTGYSDIEKLSPTFNASMTGERLVVGGNSGSCAAARYLYGAAWFLGDAEMSDATVKALLEALGWTIPWT